MIFLGPGEYDMSCVILREFLPHVKAKPPFPIPNSLFLLLPCVIFIVCMLSIKEMLTFPVHDNCTPRVACNPGLCQPSTKPNVVLITSLQTLALQPPNHPETQTDN